MKDKKRVFLLIGIMAVACISVTGSTIAMLYNTAVEGQREVLVATVQSQARLIEAISEFNATYLKDHPGGPPDSTLDQLIEAHKKYRGIGKTGEFTLAKRDGDNIVFLLSHRYYDFDTPKPVSMDSDLAEPMRLALSGLSGTIIGLDYRGEKVLAAYQPVRGLEWGIVAKIDLAEIRGPFLRVSIIALLVAAIVILVGTRLFLNITNPIMERLRKHSQSLAEMVASLQENEKLLQKARDELETRVNERTAELVEAKETLELEVHERSLAEQRLQELWNIAEMVNLEYQDLCEHILQGSLRMTQSQFAFYGFLNRDESSMSIYAWSREVSEQCCITNRQIDYPIDRAGIWAEAVRKRKVFVVNDYAADNPGKSGLPEGHVPLTRILVVPVFERDRIAALVAVANKSEDYNEEDAKQLASYAAGVQIIIGQRKTESELKESEKKYSALVENSLTGIYIAQNSRIVFANRRFAEMHGYSIPEVIGMESGNLIHPEEKIPFDAIQQKRLRGEDVPQTIEVKGIKKTGESLWTNRSSVVIEFQGAPAILGNAIDITRRKAMEEELLKSEKECRILSRQVIEAEENEKKKIAREIHDGIGQSLAAIKYRAENHYLTARQEGYGKAEELKDVVKMIQNTMEEMRRIHQALHPAHIEELGLVKTLSYFCEEFQQTFLSIKVEKSIELSEPEVPEFLKTSLFRIFQEAVNNAARHSQAGRIRCRLWKNGENIELTVQDNGIGFDARNGESILSRGKGLGLYSMKERAGLSGGELQVKSSPGNGTLVHVIWPCRNAIPES